MANRVGAIAEHLAEVPSATLAGWAAKALALRYQIEKEFSFAGVVQPEEFGPIERLAWGLTGDLMAAGGVGVSARRGLPLGDALQATVERLHAMAAESGDRLFLSDGPVTPDWHLLDLCAEAAHQRKVVMAADEITRTHVGWMKTPALVAARETEKAAEAKLLQLLRAIGKMKATTPAGLYAKALAVQVSASGAAVLARSLAQDSLDYKELRAGLWPAGGPQLMDDRISRSMAAAPPSMTLDQWRAAHLKGGCSR